MIPCLYTETETAFTTNGIGKLCDALSCYVTEKRNGAYELKMEYPSFGIHAEDVIEGNIILAKPSERATAQPFRIYKITTPLTGLLEVQARHIQYQENFITVSLFSAQGSQAAMEAIKSHTTTDCPFDFWTDIDSSATFSITSPATVRGCLGGMDGSMLDTYGGEYEWDMYTAMLHGHRGADHGVKIVYGKNLIDFKMERSIENMITGVHPYWKHSEDGTLMELPEKVVTVEHDGPFEKISVLDCTSQFEEKPTEAQLRNYVNSYLRNTSLTEPDIDIKIDFAQLWQTPGYADIAEAERVSLCDTVHDQGRTGITLAAVLLFGTDNMIASACAHHKTDCIYRVYNLDRYDDRDVIDPTNLLDSYERMFDFGQKHLNDLFVLDGIQSVSARDAILREIISNSLAHRDYSNAFIAKMIIERNRILMENGNRAHGVGALNIDTFEPFPKNPAITKVFREIGFADELGSGMRNSYKYTKLYSGGEPEFIEGDVFKIIIPLTTDSVTKVGSGTQAVRRLSTQVVRRLLRSALMQNSGPPCGCSTDIAICPWNSCRVGFFFALSTG